MNYPAAICGGNRGGKRKATRREQSELRGWLHGLCSWRGRREPQNIEEADATNKDSALIEKWNYVFKPMAHIMASVLI